MRGRHEDVKISSTQKMRWKFNKNPKKQQNCQNFLIKKSSTQRHFLSQVWYDHFCIIFHKQIISVIITWSNSWLSILTSILIKLFYSLRQDWIKFKFNPSYLYYIIYPISDFTSIYKSNPIFIIFFHHAFLNSIPFFPFLYFLDIMCCSTPFHTHYSYITLI